MKTDASAASASPPDASIVTALAAAIRADQSIPADDQDFTPTVDLFDYGYLDSFGVVSLIAQVSQQFGVDMSRLDFYEAGYRNIDGIAAYISANKAP